MPKPEVPAKDLQLDALVDEYAEVRQRMMALEPNVNPDAQRFDELEAEVLERAKPVEAEKSIIMHGQRFTLPVSPRRKVRTMLADALPKLLKKFGRDKFLAACTLPLGAVDKLVPADERKKYLKEAFTGPRIIGEPVVKQEGSK